jgi:hypothetical protein
MPNHTKLLKNIKLEQITGIHPAALKYSEAFSCLFFDAIPEMLSKCAVEQLVQLHPIHVSQSDTFELIAGFRSYQLSLIYFDAGDKLPVVVHKEMLEEGFVRCMAEADLLASRIMHSLGSKPAKQLKAIIEHIGEESANQLVPGLTKNRSIQRVLKS